MGSILQIASAVHDGLAKTYSRSQKSRPESFEHKWMIIKTKHFILRPYRMSDAESIAKNSNDKTIARNMLTVPYPYTINDANRFLKRIMKLTKSKKSTSRVFAIEIDGELVGAIGMHNIHVHKAEIGYWLARKYWGKGIMTRVVKEIVKLGFGEMGLSRIYAGTFPHNKASMRVLEKAGFKFEGILRKNLKKGDKLIDEYFFARVK